MVREICFDTETTGMDPEAGDKLVEIGCVELIDGIITDNSYHVYINPERDVPEEAVAVHGLTTEHLKQFKPFRDIAKEFVDYIGNDILIAHNAGFDMKFINYELEVVGLGKRENKVIDTLEISRHKFPGQKNSLDALCKRFKIDASRRVKHGALLDAELLAEVYKVLTESTSNVFGSQENAEDQVKLNEERFNKILNEIKNKKVLESRHFDLSQEELTQHIDFINGSFKENFWNYTKSE